MRTTNRIISPLVPVVLAALVPSLALLNSCEEVTGDVIASSDVRPVESKPLAVEPESIARMFSELPLTLGQVREVFDGVNASSSNGYDEEYPFLEMFSSPGSGVGDDLADTRALRDYPSPLCGMVSSMVESYLPTRSASFLDELSASGLQIYWPYSDRWDGRSLPVITFCPAEPGETNIGFSRRELPDGSWIVEEIVVDEAFAAAHPVWVINYNTDSGAITPQMLEKSAPAAISTRGTDKDFKTLKLKEFKAHRQYDPWLSGGSEFFCKIGALKAFKADVVADLSLYSPEITDLMIKVKRSQVGRVLRYNTILVSDWSGQLEECAFLLTEDDGGKMTSWKATGSVKIKSKSYGFEVEIPYHRNDDIVWRGKLSSNYFQRYNGIPNRFGDVSVTFVFD